MTAAERERVLDAARDELLALLPEAIRVLRGTLTRSGSFGPQQVTAASAVVRGLGAIGPLGVGDDFDEDEAPPDFPAADETIPANL